MVAWIVVALLVLAALAGMRIVALLSRRLDEVARQLRHRVGEEAPLHRLARALGDLVVASLRRDRPVGAGAATTRGPRTSRPAS
jgi:hypothetical protein